MQFKFYSINSIGIVFKYFKSLKKGGYFLYYFLPALPPIISCNEFVP